MKKYTFTATIEETGDGGAFVLFPHNVEQEFGVKGMVPVQATFDGIPYRGSLTRCGAADHRLGMLKSIREQLGKNPGEKVKVALWKDEIVRTVEIPADFAALLKKEKLLPAFEKLSYTHRKEYCRWITEAKKAETRTARLEKSIAMLHKGIKTPG
ncbi:MAG TPA: YdeI/OmpD-associated family protein [Acidobacteriaceae bacterium]|jgi:hypothetical protein|nr:YdeI/OmpD-associated family protein [Acidobacteriaceae bacterium]